MNASLLSEPSDSTKQPSSGKSNAACVQKYGCMAAFLIGTLGSTIVGKRLQLAAEYPLAIVQLTALSGIIAYPPIVMITLISGRISSNQVWVEWWKPAVVAIGFVLHDMLLQIGSRGALPGVLILILLKAVIPCSMAISMAKQTLNLSYSRLHWLGAVVVLMGAIVILPSQLEKFEKSVGHQQAFMQALLVTISVVPEAFAFVLLEMWFKGENNHTFVVAFWMWVCVFMLPIIELLSPVGSTLSGIPFSKVWTSISDGIRCYLVGLQPGAVPDNISIPDCAQAQRMFFWSIAFALLANISMPLCTRYGSATLLWFVRALSVPLAGLLFASTAIMGDQATPMDALDCGGLFLVVLGLLMFNYRAPLKNA